MKKQKDSKWYLNYKMSKSHLLEKKFLTVRMRGWLNYQSDRVHITEEEILLLDELTPLLGYNWRTGPPKKVKKVKRLKRDNIDGFGDRLKQARKDYGYRNFERYSIQIGFAESTIKDWENNVSVPTADRLLRICAFLDVSADYLLFGDQIWDLDDV